MDGTRATPSPRPSPTPRAHASVPGTPGAPPHAPAAAPPLRLASFDPPPPDAAAPNLTHTLDHVLDDVEQVAEDIDALLRSASGSGLGPAIDVSDPGDSTAAGMAAIADDDDMLRIFDDQRAADLKTIDRLLAQQAEQALDGAFESIDHALAEPGMHDLGAVIAARPVAAASAAANPPAGPATLPRAQQADASPLPSFPPTPLAAPPSPVAAVLAVAEIEQPATSPIPAIAGIGMGERVAVPLNTVPAAAPQAASEAATGSATPPMQHEADQSLEFNAFGTPPAPSASRPRLRSWLAFALGVLGGPMRLVPASLRPAVNALALSLALWSPLVWFGAPRLADYRQTRAHAAIKAPAHGQSTLKSDAGGEHGRKAADDHAAKPGKNSDKKAKAKASGGH